MRGGLNMGEGFRLKGREDYSDILIEHTDWPGTLWRLMIPEYAWIGEAERARKVEWTEREGSCVSWRWADEEAKRQAGNDFWGSARVLGREEIQYELTFQNLGEEAWRQGQSSLICLISGNAPQFHDYEGHRTFVYECTRKRFIDIDEIQDGRWADHRMWGGKLPGFAGEGRPAVERLMLKISKDGEYVLGIATDEAIGVSCNHQESMSCIHSNPHWGALAPGQSKTVHGRIYLFRGTAQDILGRCRKDFGSVCDKDSEGNG